MHTEEKIKCHNCGFLNINGSKKCGRCGAVLKKTKSCPRCAKRNKLEAKKCINCGYYFKSNKKIIIKNFLISLFIVAFLSILLALELTGIVENIDIALKICAVIVVILIFYTAINYGSKSVVDYSNKVDIKLDKERYNKMRKINNISIIVGGIIVGVILIYFFVIK